MTRRPSHFRRLLAAHGTSVLGSGLLLLALGLLLWACLQPPISLSDSSGSTGGDGSASSSDGGSSAIVGLFTISGCSELSFPSTGPRCVASAPASLRLVLLAVGATMHRFQVVRLSDTMGADGGVMDGGSADAGETSILDESSSRAEAPAFTLSQPGSYQVTLGVAGPGGTDTSVGVIVVLPVPLGSSCGESAQCQSPTRCLCDRSAGCPGALGHGLCSQGCDGLPCPVGTACIDLSRSSGNTDAGTDAWRQPLCVPTCGGDAGCRSDFLCRELPVLKPGEKAGGAFAFGRACFAENPADVGASCNLPDGTQNPMACAMGICLDLGLRGLCSAACTTASDCPSAAACAAFSGPGAPAPAAPRCVARCDAMHPCSDPLLACQLADSSGGLGFTLPGAAGGTTVCTPKRCSGAADCPGGSCVARGVASFCSR